MQELIVLTAVATIFVFFYFVVDRAADFFPKNIAVPGKNHYNDQKERAGMQKDRAV